MNNQLNKDLTESRVPLTGEEAHILLKQTPGWEIITRDDITLLQRVYVLGSTNRAVEFSKRVMTLAEEHHAPRRIINDDTVTVEWWTAPFNGLHENDFILAKNTDVIYASEFQETDKDQVQEASEESFPASDPPATY